MLFPLARPVPGTDGQLLNKRRKKALIVLAGALPACPVGRFYVSVKRSPCAFGFCVRLVCAGCLRGKKGLLFLLAFKRKKISIGARATSPFTKS
jgi:hypothetical protein